MNKIRVAVAWVATLAVGLAAAEPTAFQDSVGGDGIKIDMIVVEAGEFVMGSPESESGRARREGPQHKVSFAKPFAVSRTEISVEQFASFVAATGYMADAEKRGSGKVFNARNGKILDKAGVSWKHDFRGAEAVADAPVIRVSWRDAQAFVSWLSANTGRAYRLPSEAEFEYALRAGSTSRYWWGDGSPDRAVENVTGDKERLKELRWPVGFRGYTDRHWGPAPVGSFEANPFGLHDMGGNAAEWVQDCYSESLTALPGDGVAGTTGNCDMRVFRGGAWGYAPPLVRSAYRNAATEDHSSPMVGFRVAVDLSGDGPAQARR